MPVIQVNRVGDKKRIIRKNGGPRRKAGTKNSVPGLTKPDLPKLTCLLRR
jgi:hypothetical protein